eukprot:scaffold70717_cov42-Cyclotella_meneghiniana.AAC.9
MTDLPAPPPASDRLRRLNNRFSAGLASVLGSGSAPTAASSGEGPPAFLTPAGAHDGEFVRCFSLWL